MKNFKSTFFAKSKEISWVIIFIFFLATIVPILGTVTPGAILIISTLTAAFLTTTIHWIRKNSKIQSSIKRFASYILITQIILLVWIPGSSIIPLSWLNSVGYVEIITEKHCDINAYHKAGTEVWGDTLDQKNVRIVAGGWMANLNFIKEIFQLPISQNFIRAGLAFNDTIYVIKATECISNHVYVHELTHVWQFQNSHQPLQIWEASAYLYLQAKSPSTLYDFGGYDGLSSAYQNGKVFNDFSIEQQAEIVMAFYIYKDNERIAQFFEVSEEEAVKFASSDLVVDFLQILANYRLQMLNEVPKNY